MDSVDRVGGRVLDHVRTMRRALINALALLIGLCFGGWGTYAVAADYTWASSSYVTEFYGYPSPDALCRAVFAAKLPTLEYHSATPTGNPAMWTCNRWNASHTGPVGQTSAVREGSGCTAPKTYNPVTGACEAPPGPTCTAGRVFETTIAQGTKLANGSTSDMKYPSNVAGCVVTVEELLYCSSNAANEVFCRYRLKETGAVAPSGSADTPTTTEPAGTDNPTTVPPFNPGQGQGCPRGTVNLGTDSTGGSICGGGGTAPETAPKNETTYPTETTTNPDGTTTTTDKETRLNRDGSTTTTTRTCTTLADGRQTCEYREETSATTDGSTGKADPAPDEPKEDLCKQNPQLNICRNSTISGSCAETSCEGDAIQCAIAREVRDENCRQKLTEDAIKASAQYVLGNQVLGGNDPQAGSLPTKANGATWSMPTSLDQSGWLGGGSCFADKSFTVQGHTVVIPFSKTCDILIVFRYVSMIIAMLVAFKLLSGTILLRT